MAKLWDEVDVKKALAPESLKALSERAKMLIAEAGDLDPRIAQIMFNMAAIQIHIDHKGSDNIDDMPQGATALLQMLGADGKELKQVLLNVKNISYGLESAQGSQLLAAEIMAALPEKG